MSEILHNSPAGVEHTVLWNQLVRTVQEHAFEAGIQATDDFDITDLSSPKPTIPPERIVLVDYGKEDDHTLQLWAQPGLVRPISAVTLVYRDSDTDLDDFKYSVTPNKIV